MIEKEIDVFIQNLKDKTTVLQQLIVCIEECKKLICYTENVKQMVEDLDIESANSKLNEIETSLGNLILTVEGIQGDVNNLDLALQGLDLSLQALTNTVNNKHLYCHSITLGYAESGEEVDKKILYFNIYTESSTLFTLVSLKEYLQNHTNAGLMIYRNGAHYDYMDDSQSSYIKNITIRQLDVSVVSNNINCDVEYFMEGDEYTTQDIFNANFIDDVITQIY